ncbi:unnamed protein product [Pedinophyceae sp. YPF-701]|nr:unnamed protein product [Pedinophyceae sp. YPF-701]
MPSGSSGSRAGWSGGEDYSPTMGAAAEDSWLPLRGSVYTGSLDRELPIATRLGDGSGVLPAVQDSPGGLNAASGLGADLRWDLPLLPGLGDLVDVVDDDVDGSEPPSGRQELVGTQSPFPGAGGYGRAATSDTAPDESAVCAVCLEGPAESGLVHNNGVLHRCVCRECATKLRDAKARCPLCREAILAVVHKIVDSSS